MARTKCKPSEDFELYIEDDYVNIHYYSGALYRITWKDNFTLKDLGKAILINFAKNSSKDWTKVGNIKITIEIIDEDFAHFCIDSGIIALYLNVPQSEIEPLAKFFIDNQ